MRFVFFLRRHEHRQRLAIVRGKLLDGFAELKRIYSRNSKRIILRYEFFQRFKRETKLVRLKIQRYASRNERLKYVLRESCDYLPIFLSWFSPPFFIDRSIKKETSKESAARYRSRAENKRKNSYPFNPVDRIRESLNQRPV